MPTTAINVITQAFVDMGELAVGEVISSDDANTGLTLLNNLLDQLSTERLGVFAWLYQSFALVANSGSPAVPYTLGPGGTLAGVRPIEIRAAQIVLNFTSINGTNITTSLRIPLPVLSIEQYSQIKQKDLKALIPEGMYSDQNFPLANVFLYPVPIISGVLTLEFWSWLALTQLATLTTPFSMPPGYQLAIQKLLAVNMCSSYGRTPPNDLVALANQYKANLANLNRPPIPGAMEESLVGMPPQPPPPQGGGQQQGG